MSLRFPLVVQISRILYAGAGTAAAGSGIQWYRAEKDPLHVSKRHGLNGRKLPNKSPTDKKEMSTLVSTALTFKTIWIDH